MQTNSNVTQSAPVVIATTNNQLQDVLNKILPSLVRETLRDLKEEDLQEKLLSPEETCKLFTPKISKPTLDSYSEKGYFQKYYLEGRTWYRYSEILSALKVIKRYSRNVIAEQ